MKSFRYLLGQSKGNPEVIRKGMPAVVLHQFGFHNNWCRLKDNTTARIRNQPWGADLQNSQLKKELLVIFIDLDVNKLSKIDSTNRKERFNNIVRSKAPKDKHYSESCSFNRRLAATACKKLYISLNTSLIIF